jgi:LmbE family N-acetylglucosaminyl deacetylase
VKKIKRCIAIFVCQKGAVYMAEVRPVQYSLDVSRAFFTHPNSYTPFSVTNDKRRVIACVEPRNEVRAPGEKILTALQTAGGGAGEALDRAVEETAYTGDFHDIGSALDDEVKERGDVLGGHYRCKFIGGMGLVLAEMARPSDFTMHDFERTLADYDIAEDVLPVMPRVSDSVKRHYDHVQQAEVSEALIDALGQHYPNHRNVADVHGDNTSQLYVTNDHSHVGLDRDRKASFREVGIDVQGYHESRRATFDDIATSYRLNREERTLRIGAQLLRNSATRTVLGGLQPNTEFWHVSQSRDGLLIVQQEGL